MQEYLRQFVLGPRNLIGNFIDRRSERSRWSVVDIGMGRDTAVQQDLHCAVARSAEAIVVCLGEMIDPAQPEKSNDSIAQSLIASRDVWDCFRLTETLGGRWIIYFRTSTAELMFHDPCGLRQIFYTYTPEGPLAGSTPAILYDAASQSLVPDSEIARFRASKGYISSEHAMAGCKTEYKGCWHLLPNHVLDFSNLSSRRFFPADEILRLDLKVVAPEAVALLEGTLSAISHRSPMRMALTAGYDSRVLLAVARPFLSHIDVYIDKFAFLGSDHMDVRTSRRIAHDIGMPLEIMDSSEEPNVSFVGYIQTCVGEYRDIPKMRMIYNAWKHGIRGWNVNGNGAAICRNFFDKRGEVNADDANLDLMVRLLAGAEDNFVRQELAAWRDQPSSHGLRGYHPLDLLY